MDAVRLFEIQFTEAGEHKGFFEGQEVEGIVRVELKEDVVIDNLSIEFTGTAQIQMAKDQHKRGKSKSKRSNPIKTEGTKSVSIVDEKYLNQNLTLYSRESTSQNFLVGAGPNEYNFRIQLPYNVPSSVVATWGSIRYYATATLTRPWHPKAATCKEFRVRTLVDLNQLPQSVRPVTSEVVEDKSMLCCVVGSIHATWYLQKSAYMPGEDIDIQGLIHNRSRVKIRRSKASLVQHIRYFDPTETRYLHERRELASAVQGEVVPSGISVWRETISVPILVPPSGLKGCTLMDINYVLKIKVVPAGPLHTLESCTEVVIGSVALGETLENYDRTATLQAQRDAEVNSATAVDMNYFV